jgi:LPS export ABC transporter protein LptC
VRPLYTLSSIALLALLIGWFQLDDKSGTHLLVPQDENFMDAYMRDFSLVAMDAQGKPGYVLNAARMSHFSNSDSASLEQPVFVFPGKESEWRISADRGQINDAHDQILLQHNVVMQQSSHGETRPELRLETDELSIDARSQLATTQAPVMIIQQKMQLQSRGMTFDNRNGKLELLTRVKGSYVRTP